MTLNVALYGLSPRCRASSSSSDRYQSANDEGSDEGSSSDSQEDVLGTSPSPSLPARILSLRERGEDFRGVNTHLSPDRTSHDGVEVQQPSSTPTSRCAKTALQEK